jgi:hypothetical protein
MVPLVPSLLLALSFYVSGQRTVHPAKAYSPNDLEEKFSEVQKKLTQNTNSINSWLKFIADSSPWPILSSAEGNRRFWGSDARWKGGRENGEAMKDCPG